jgi:hypothetical protein
MKYSVDLQALFWHTYFTDRDKRGWTEVRLSNNGLALKDQEMYEWLDDTITNKWHGVGTCWLFQRPEDAVVFSLRWL